MAYKAAAAAYTVNPFIVQYYDFSVFGVLHVKFYAVSSKLYCKVKCFKRIFRRITRCAPMRPNKRNIWFALYVSVIACAEADKIQRFVFNINNKRIP